MTREEVIRGLAVCSDNGWDCDACPYEGKKQCYDEVRHDAVSLLREQEPVEPLLQTGGNYVCGRCQMYTVGFQHPITGKSVKTWKYCPACGRKVRWE